MHHGSSISHGSVATYPTETWPVVAARLAGLDLVNLGLGGSALLDPFVARTIRDTPADLISLKLGINLVNQDLLRRRALGPAVHGYLDTIRDGHPETPVRLVSPIYCGIHESVPGPTGVDMAGIAEGRVAFVAEGDPAAVARGGVTPRGRPRGAGRGRRATRRPAPVVRRRARRSTARPTPSGSRSPTTSTPTPRPTASSASGSRRSGDW